MKTNKRIPLILTAALALSACASAANSATTAAPAETAAATPEPTAAHRNRWGSCTPLPKLGKTNSAM